VRRSWLAHSSSSCCCSSSAAFAGACPCCLPTHCKLLLLLLLLPLLLLPLCCHHDCHCPRCCQRVVLPGSISQKCRHQSTILICPTAMILRQWGSLSWTERTVAHPERPGCVGLWLGLGPSPNIWQSPGASLRRLAGFGLPVEHQSRSICFGPFSGSTAMLSKKFMQLRLVSMKRPSGRRCGFMWKALHSSTGIS